MSWLSVVVLPPAGLADGGPCLNSLAALGPQVGEVIWLAGSPPSSPPAGIQLRVEEPPRDGLGAAANLGWSLASGQVVLFTRSDCRVPPHMPTRLRLLRSEPGPAGVCGGSRPILVDHALEQLWSWRLQWAGSRPGALICPRPACAAFTRPALELTGGWDPGLCLGADCDPALAARLENQGLELVWDPELWVRQPLPRTWGQVWAAQFQEGAQDYERLRLGLGAGGALAQSGLALAGLALLLGLAPWDPARGLGLAVVSQLLLYYGARPFLKYLAGQDPALVGKGLLLAWTRSWAGGAGLAARALGRGGRGKTL